MDNGLLGILLVLLVALLAAVLFLCFLQVRRAATGGDLGAPLLHLS